MGNRALSLQGFFVDRYPVTNKEWQEFILATGEFPPAHWLGTRIPNKQERHPVVGISLTQARRYASWKGRRLPTQAEWLSLVHGEEGRAFPWGDHCEKSQCQCELSGARETAAVDAHPANVTPEGVTDLLGNVWEWTEADRRLPAPDAGSTWAMGGSFRHPCKGGVVPATSIPIENTYLYLGFRCASDVEED